VTSRVKTGLGFFGALSDPFHLDDGAFTMGVGELVSEGLELS
jgi:hypothetical protein